MPVLIGFVLLAAAGALLALRVEPVPTWFYVFAWYPVLIILDGASRRGRPEEPSWLIGKRGASLFGWSIIIWLMYELANFRLENWYYVNLPRGLVERWSGILVSFATVVPALFLAERLLRRVGVGERWRPRPVPARPWHWRAIAAAGVVMGLAALAWPRYLSPLVWGAGVLVVDPYVRSRIPHRSLLADLDRGAPGRIVRLLVGGLGIGLLWEGLNHAARARWIYTVPFLEGFKLFEMPPIGFVGFPIFALSAWSAYYALVAAGVATDPEEAHGARLRGFRTLVTGSLCAVAAGAMLHQMDYRTVSSTVATLADVPGVEAAGPDRLAAAGIGSVTDLGALDASEVSALAPALGIPDTAVARLVQVARLITLRGIGANHARELQRARVTTVCELAGTDPAVVWEEIHALYRGLGPRPTAAEVRVWHRAARRACPG